MFILKKLWCRLYQLGFRAAIPILPYREPKILSCCDALEPVLIAESVKSVLIVTDAGIVKNKLTSSVEAVLAKNQVPYVIYDQTCPNPTVDNVEAALALYRSHRCDALIAIGGGSSIDCAKVVGARAVYPNRSVHQLGGKLKIWKKLPTLIAVPTTAGTGSEVTVAALVSEPQTHQKYALMSFPLIPHYAVLDPALTVSLPPHLTATTGMDALTHAVEAYIGRSSTAQTRALALDAVKLIFENIRTAYSDGSNLHARENMLHASYRAGVAFSISYVGYIHAIAHSLGGRYGIPHGLANAVIMPYVLEAYGACAYKKLHRLGIAAGVCSEEDSTSVGAKKFIEAVKELNAEMHIPCTLGGIMKEDIAPMAQHAAREANPLYPVPKLMTASELECFYHIIAEGDTQK